MRQYKIMAIRFKNLVLPSAVMICGGYRCLGSEYSDFIADFNISGYAFNNMGVICTSDNEVTLHYIIQTQSKDANAQDLVGTFHVVSIRKRINDAWHLIFYMDPKIV